MKNKFSRIRFTNEYFLFLLPLFFVLHGFVENLGSVSISGAFLLAGKYLAGALVLFLLCYFLLKSGRKAAIFSFLLLLINFFFGVVHDFLKVNFPAHFISRYSFILPFLLLIIIVVFILLRRTKYTFTRLTHYLNILFIVLILVDVVQLFIIKNAEPPRPTSTFNYPVLKCDTCSKPDIYLILADEYAGYKELKDQFNFDNGEFQKQLASRDFFVVPNSLGNYNFTPYAIASLLNMEYMVNIDNYVSSQKGLNTAYSKINKNSLADFLKIYGYTIINNSIFKIDGQPAKTEQSALVNNEGLISSQTFLNRIYKDIGYHLVTSLKISSFTHYVTYTDHRNNEILLKKLMEEVNDSSAKDPRFVYTHLMLPHYPYYVNKSGIPNPLDSITEGNQHKQGYYLEYLQYANTFYLQILDSILSKSKTDPIIILMSDHGFREFTEPVHRQYQYMTLNAIYLPNKKYTGFYDGMSNVNMFRVLLNTQFGQQLPLLKDSTIFLEER